MKTKDFTCYSAPRAEVVEISVEAGFAGTTTDLPGFTIDPTEI